MKASAVSALAVCLLAATTTSVSAQMSPLTLLMLGDGAEGLMDMYSMENSGMMLWLYQSLQNRINALELRVKSGAVGGCESGVIGPFTPTALTGTITFQQPFLGAPAVSLSLSDMTTSDPNLTINVQIRPEEISSTQATVKVTDATGALATVHVAYMACPSNSFGSSSSDS